MSNDDFLGRTVTGPIEHYSSGIANQANPQDLLDALDKVLALPGVEGVRWQQYTPYFNDGEACEFGVRDAMVKIVGDDEEAGDWGNGWRDAYEFHYNRVEVPGVDVEPIAAAIRAFSSELGSHHYVVLNQKFGDPAQVTATTEGFEVEFYEHD